MASRTTPITKLMRKDAAENRARILAAASQVFADIGIEASVDDIARVAGVGMGTLYRRFPTKDALIAELVHELLAEILDEARRALEPHDGQGLRRFLYASAEQQVKHRGCLSRLWRDDDAPLVAEVHDLIAQLLADAKEHGQVRTDVDSSDVFVVLCSIKGIIDRTQSVSHNGWRRHLEVVIAGLQPTSATFEHPPLTAQQIKAIRALQAKR